MATLRLYVAIPARYTAEEIETGKALVSVSASPTGIASGWPRFVIDVEIPWPEPAIQATAVAAEAEREEAETG